MGGVGGGAVLSGFSFCWKLELIVAIKGGVKTLNFGNWCPAKGWWCKVGAHSTINNHKTAQLLMWLIWWSKWKGVENLQGFTVTEWSKKGWQLFWGSGYYHRHTWDDGLSIM